MVGRSVFRLLRIQCLVATGNVYLPPDAPAPLRLLEALPLTSRTGIDERGKKGIFPSNYVRPAIVRRASLTKSHPLGRARLIAGSLGCLGGDKLDT
jgi:hypothetical protein